MKQTRENKFEGRISSAAAIAFLPKRDVLLGDALTVEKVNGHEQVEGAYGTALEQSAGRKLVDSEEHAPSALPGLSGLLRRLTMTAHQLVEKKMRLPGSIASLTDYENCLARFLALYRPLGASLMRFDGWASLNIDVPKGLGFLRIAADLEELGNRVREVVDAPGSCLPLLPDFAHALGALYVVEGSALGSRVILLELRRVLGDELIGADSFFSGRGDATADFWRGFRGVLDRYGMDHPAKIGAVIEGANATFAAIGTWMEV